MKILLSGGGSGGPVSPVLAVAKEIKRLKPDTEFLFVGTKKGPESKMVAELDIKFEYIPASKLRRYFSVFNLIEPFKFITAFIKSYIIVKKFKPDVVFGAGSFVCVPVAWAGKLQKTKIVIHQQDARIGLANKLIAPFADQITTAFEYTAKQFYSGSGLNPKNQSPAEWVGNPVRPELRNVDKNLAQKHFNLHDALPVLLVLGGATGAKQINELIAKLLPELVSTNQVIHQTGIGKNTIDFKHNNYHPVELLPFDIYASALHAAHLVIARAGLSTIAELSSLSKPAIIIPMPHTHQEDNAAILTAMHAAAVLMRNDATPENLVKVINSIKYNPKRQSSLSESIHTLMPSHAAEKLAKIIIRIHESET